MDARRRALGMSWEELALAAQVGRETLRRVREGGGGPKAVRNVEAQLRWRLGSVAAIDEGGEPTPEADPAVARPAWPDGTASTADQLREIWRRVGSIEFWGAVKNLQDEFDQAAESHHRTGA